MELDGAGASASAVVVAAVAAPPVLSCIGCCWECGGTTEGSYVLSLCGIVHNRSSDGLHFVVVYLIRFWCVPSLCGVHWFFCSFL